MFAHLLLAQADTRISYSFERWTSFREWWQGPALILGFVVIVALVIYMYRRDSAELRPGVSWLLLGLRVAAFAGLLLFFLDLQKRSERRVVHNSRVLLLVDTSLSMAVADEDTSSSAEPISRSRQVAAELADGDLVKSLRKAHDVIVLRFDKDVVPVATLPKVTAGGDEPTPEAVDAAATKSAAAVNWEELLRPQGSETRLGQALQQAIDQQRPLAGIVVFTDGGQNSGLEPTSVLELAEKAEIPVFTVGLGSDQRPVNVRISDFVVPARAYPGDSFSVTGYVQSEGLAGRMATVELLSRPGGEGGPGQLEGAERITLGTDGEIQPVKFELKGSDQTGRRTLQLRVRLNSADTDLNPEDNQQEQDVEIVDRKLKVLLFAGGPTREYQFLRNQLRRDKDTVVDVLLQTAVEGVSQDANEVLYEFPGSKEKLYDYDCIVAFDPDWQKLTSEQIGLLEHWVAEQHGGLITIAGPIHTDALARDRQLSKVRQLYPVEFSRHFAGLDRGDFGSSNPWPIEFTREGLEAPFLWLGDSASASRQVWSDFEGVYGHYRVQDAKPGATIYGRYSNPEAAGGGEQPAYFAEHFYGSGRVFYLGSGEMWRLRKLDDSYLEQLYVKLLRHVSQGRLLRGSSRGVLLAERDRYLLGSNVVIRAQLNNAQQDPLEVPQVALQVIQPQGRLDSVTLSSDPTRKGMYSGEFPVMSEGVYRLELEVPESGGELITKRIQVRVPDLEARNPQRNDALLNEIAQGTGGRVYFGIPAIRESNAPLVAQFRDRTDETYVAGAPDREWDENWMRWILIGTCGVLCLEWLVRRLSKLA